jgi:hypothetical protein
MLYSFSTAISANICKYNLKKRPAQEEASLNMAGFILRNGRAAL